MKESIVKIVKSNIKGKKYTAHILNKQTKKTRIIHFGSSINEQYKDSTSLKSFSHKNHNDFQRRKNYFSRFSNGITNKSDALKHEINKSNGIYNAKILSHRYLW